jgi:uncharacterized protein (TIGR00369 family)
MVDGVQQERQEVILSRARRSRLARTFGYSVHYDADGASVLDMPYNAALDNGMGGVHGGVVAALIDVAGWYAAAPRYQTWITTVEFQTRLLEPAFRTDVQAVGRVVRAGKRMAVVEVEVRSADGVLIAMGHGSFLATSRAYGAEPGEPS